MAKKTVFSLNIRNDSHDENQTTFAKFKGKKEIFGI